MAPMTDAALSAFEQFVPQAEGRLRRALVSIYGPSIGRDAAMDALSWAWENWDRQPLPSSRFGTPGRMPSGPRW